MHSMLASAIHTILLIVSMFFLWRFYYNFGFHAGYLECESPEPFPKISFFITISLCVVYFIFSAIITYMGIADFASQIYMFALYAAIMFTLNAVLALILFLPSYKMINLLVSLTFAAPFAIGVVLIKVFHLN